MGQLAEMVHHRVDDFLMAVGFDERFMAACELISDEIAKTLQSTSGASLENPRVITAFT